MRGLIRSTHVPSPGLAPVEPIPNSSISLCILLLSIVALISGVVLSKDAAAQLSPLIAKGKAVDWFFVYKFNTKSFPECAGNAARSCPFDDGEPVEYLRGFGQQYVFSSSTNPQVITGNGCLGDTETDPVGATFDEIYNGTVNYVVWNDQFYNDPHIAGCGDSCGGPWGHSKGILAWDNEGDGLVMQVTTPSWPGAGSRTHPRADGNSLGCIAHNNVLVGQHFFAVRLTPEDVLGVARGLANASIVTNLADPQIVSSGGPPPMQTVVASLGTKSKSDQILSYQLAAVPDVRMISKPAKLHAPPWQLLSSVLGSIDLRVATWWTSPKIPDTAAGQEIDCWPSGTKLKPPGAVVNAVKGHWDKQSFSLLGSGSSSGNHAKIGVSTSGDHPYAIFADLNQQGALSGLCQSSQNGRGGTFYVFENKSLHDAVESLISERRPESLQLSPSQ